MVRHLYANRGYAIKYQISVGSFYFLFWGSIFNFILDIYLKLQLEIDIT